MKVSMALDPRMHRLRRDPPALFGLIGLGVLSGLALLAPVLAPFAPSAIHYDALLQPPGRTHWLGTDDLGRDILSRILWGGRESLRVGFLGVAVAMAGGVAVGVIAGYHGGWVDGTLMRVADVFMAFPALLLMLSVIAILGPGLTTTIMALGIASIPGYARLVRGSVLSARHFEYVVAARVVGAASRRILWHHILPNIVGVLMVYSTVGFGDAILVTAGLSFLGLGAQPPSPEWGAMLNAGTPFLREAWWVAGFPGLVIFMAVLCINLLGDGLRDALDPRLQG
jgi:ABC-type dipeptide/oligopeptide/nickel transport system permease subunit